MKIKTYMTSLHSVDNLLVSKPDILKEFTDKIRDEKKLDSGKLINRPHIKGRTYQHH